MLNVIQILHSERKIEKVVQILIHADDKFYIKNAIGFERGANARAGVGIPSVAISSRSSVPHRSVVICTSVSFFQLATLFIIDFGG